MAELMTDMMPGAQLRNGRHLRGYFAVLHEGELGSLHLAYPDGTRYTIGSNGRVLPPPGAAPGTGSHAAVVADALQLLKHPTFIEQEVTRLRLSYPAAFFSARHIAARLRAIEAIHGPPPKSPAPARTGDSNAQTLMARILTAIRPLVTKQNAHGR